MWIWKCVLLYCVFMINPPSCNTFTIQQQNQTPLSVSSLHMAEASVDTSSKVGQNQRQKKDFPGKKGPIDPLSIRQIKGSQKRRPVSGSVDQTAAGQNRSVNLTERNRNITNQEKLEIPVSTSATNTQKNISVSTRIVVPGAKTGFVLPVKKPSLRTRTIKQGFRTSFGLPLDHFGSKVLLKGISV